MCVSLQAIALMVDGKIIIETEKATHIREIQGEEMIEVCFYFIFISLLLTINLLQKPNKLKL